MKLKTRGLFFLGGAVFFLIGFFVILSLSLGRLMKSGDSTTGLDEQVTEPIAVVEIEGIILQSRKIIDRLIQAEENKKAKAIIIRIDSPGGAVGPTQEIYEEIRRIDAVKPVYACLSSVAASGGYYVASAARKIFTNAGTLTGSIGVIMEFMDLSEVYQFLKLNPQTVKGGKFKDIGSPMRPLSAEERMMMEDMIKGVHQQFRRDILATRKDKLKKDIEEITQGQIFSGEEAIENGLADELGSVWSAGRKIHKELKLQGKFGLWYVPVKKKFSFGEFLGDLDESTAQLKEFVKLKLGNSQRSVPLLLYSR